MVSEFYDPPSSSAEVKDGGAIPSLPTHRIGLVLNKLSTEIALVLSMNFSFHSFVLYDLPNALI
jgi:hypothetical protein